MSVPCLCLGGGVPGGGGPGPGRGPLQPGVRALHCHHQRQDCGCRPNPRKGWRQSELLVLTAAIDDWWRGGDACHIFSFVLLWLTWTINLYKNQKSYLHWIFEENRSTINRPIGAWKCYFSAVLGICDRQTERRNGPTNQQTDRRTRWIIEKLHFHQ